MQFSLWLIFEHLTSFPYYFLHICYSVFYDALPEDDDR